MECVSLIAGAVGKEQFSGDAEVSSWLYLASVLPLNLSFSSFEE